MSDAKVTLYMPHALRDRLDKTIIQYRSEATERLDRSGVIVAIIESVDLSRVVAKLARGEAIDEDVFWCSKCGWQQDHVSGEHHA